MNKTFQTMVNFYRKKDWQIIIIKPGESVGILLKMKNTSYQCISMVEEDCTFSFMSFFPEKVPIDKHPSICELIAATNYGLKHCHFQIDLIAGEVRCVSRNFLGKNNLNDSIIEELLRHNISTMDYVFPLFMKLLYTDMPVEEIIEWSLNR